MPLERARAAAAEGDWQSACQLFIEADATAALNASDLALLATSAYAAGQIDVTIDAWERAYRASDQTGDRVGAAAAAVRVAMHMVLDTALIAPVRAWLARAERLLEPNGDTPVHAWFAVVRNYERMLSGDFAGARQWAQRAISIGSHCDPAAAAIGRVAEARSLILEGDVAEGLALLNEAAVAMLAGEIDPLSTGVVYCELVCAFHALGQYDLAEEWTDAMERWRHGHAVGSIHGRCRIHRAEILRLRGACADAETEILKACEELRPYLRRELGWPLTELGRIRLRRGDIEGAREAFVAAHEAGWDPQPGLALVQLAKGDVAGAVTSIRDALARPSTIPSKEWPPNSKLRRAPLLEAQAEIEAAAGNLSQAHAAAEELAVVAALFQSAALDGSAAIAHGRACLASGDTTEAGHHFAIAAQRWSEIGAPYETAVARMGLAEVLRLEGKHESALLESGSARAMFARIGAWYQSAPQPDNEQAAESVTFRREGDYWSVAFEGRADLLRDSKGLQYLARLIDSSGQELHVLDLVSGTVAAADAMTDAGDAGELLDRTAKAAYRRRLDEIEHDIEDAQALGDTQRAAQADAERAFLRKELARAVGLGGRDRRAGSATERARSAVTRAIRHALLRIREHNPALSQHFDRSIRTGAWCAYVPDSATHVRRKL